MRDFFSKLSRVWLSLSAVLLFHGCAQVITLTKSPRVPDVDTRALHTFLSMILVKDELNSAVFSFFKSKPTDFKIDGSLHKGTHLRLTWQEPCLLPLGLSCQVYSFITEHTAEPGTRQMFMKISSIERHELCHPAWVIAAREPSRGFPDRSDGKECPCALHPALEVAGISQSGFTDWKIKAIRGNRLGGSHSSEKRFDFLVSSPNLFSG